MVKIMEMKTKIIHGKRRIIMNFEATGEDKVKEAIQIVLGPQWHYVEDEKESKKEMKD